MFKYPSCEYNSIGNTNDEIDNQICNNPRGIKG